MRMGARGWGEGRGMRGKAGLDIGAGATHPGHNPQQGLGPPSKAHRVQGSPCTACAE